MKYLKKYKIFELNLLPNLDKKVFKDIYNKKYSNVNYNIFIQLCLIDPTSNGFIYYKGEVNTNKNPIYGKYSDWLLKQFINGKLDSYIERNGEEMVVSKDIKFIITYFRLLETNWFKTKYPDFNIDKYSFYKFINKMSNINDEYLRECLSDTLKYDLLYEDDYWRIFVPLNPQSSYYLCGKDTQWCTNSISGWKMWSLEYTLYRFVPKNNKYDKMRLSWSKGKFSWALSYTKSVYHLRGKENPFRVFDIDNESIYKKGHNKIVSQIRSLSPKAINSILDYQKYINTSNQEKDVENLKDIKY
jgi:hypothetical protein